MSAIQLSFSVRVSSNVKTVHLLGSWDHYAGQLPLSKDQHSSKSGSWKGTFRFQPSSLKPGQRYWYYYIIDGYHVSHNPSEESCVEPITGRQLNILDVPKSKSSLSSAKSSSSSHKSSSLSRQSKDSSRSRHSKRSNMTVDIPKGRPLSISQIKAPKPISLHATKRILNGEFDEDELSSQFTATAFYPEDDYYGEASELITDFDMTSPVSLTGSSLSYSSDSSSRSSNLSGYSTPDSDYGSCTCERYGITRKGERVRLDCGGSRCGFDCFDTDSSCSGSEDEAYVTHAARRNGIVVRS